MPRPLLTFAVLAYQQEQFVRKAIGGAFSQTYHPLEIILSDDASSDGTYQIMNEEVAQYSGPHSIILNRNPTNVGIGAHVNRIMEVANGELIIVAAGDDISYPHRVERLYDLYMGDPVNTVLLFSGYDKIDQNGRAFELVPKIPPHGFDDPLESCKTWLAGLPGCSAAWHRHLFEVFGPIDNKVRFEDRIILFRATLSGRVAHTQESLLGYRVHDANISSALARQGLMESPGMLQDFLNSYLNCSDDLETIYNKKKIDAQTYKLCQKEIRRKISLIYAYLGLMQKDLPTIMRSLLTVFLRAGHPVRAFNILSRNLMSKQ